MGQLNIPNTLFAEADIIAEEHNQNYSAISNFLNNKNLDSQNIADAAIITALLAPDSISANKLQTDSVSTAKIQALSITNDKIAPASLATSKITGDLTNGSIVSPSMHSHNVADISIKKVRYPDNLAPGPIIDAGIFGIGDGGITKTIDLTGVSFVMLGASSVLRIIVNNVSALEKILFQDILFNGITINRLEIYSMSLNADVHAHLHDGCRVSMVRLLAVSDFSPYTDITNVTFGLGNLNINDGADVESMTTRDRSIFCLGFK